MSSINVKIKSISVKTFEKNTKGEKKDKSQMTYEELLELKSKIAEVLDINPINVIATYEGCE